MTLSDSEAYGSKYPNVRTFKTNTGLWVHGTSNILWKLLDSVLILMPWPIFAWLKPGIKISHKEHVKATSIQIKCQVFTTTQNYQIKPWEKQWIQLTSFVDCCKHTQKHVIMWPARMPWNVKIANFYSLTQNNLANNSRQSFPKCLHIKNYRQLSLILKYLNFL